MFVDFFIRRPIFATVIALIIVLAGAVSIPTLPLAEYPEISPPKVSVTSVYTGASAQVVESAVTTPLEQQINGAQAVKYISSTSGNDGTSTINVTFDLERDIDLAAVDIQNRLSGALGRMPEEVKRTGVQVNKVSNSFVLAIGILTPDNRYSSQFLSNYADIYVRDALKRVKGVGEVRIFGERKYSMRVWLDPSRLSVKGITAQDVVSAVSDQNLQVAAGQIGQAPLPAGQMYQMSVRGVGRLKSAAEFENIVIRAGKDGQLIRIKDVGRAELGAEDYQTVVRYRGKDAVGIGIFQRPGSNALDISEGVRREMAQLAKRFPPGMTYEFAFDTTRSVKESIKEVLITLAQAIALVVVVIFLFLQSFRSTLIPVFTIPVSLIGTFAVMKVLDFSINTLTLFGITLATGLVVDDAIVVIENITRLMHDRNLSAREAASLAMREVTGAVIAISLVLAAVFVPVAFFPGTTGQLYKQFALTIAISVAISTLNALTLTPALSALWLKKGSHAGGPLFRPVNFVIDGLRQLYSWSLSLVLKVKYLFLLVFALLMVGTYWLSKAVPTAFIPEEDVGYMIVIVQAPEGVSLNYTVDVLKKIEAVLDKQPEIVSSFGVAGFSFTGTNPNNAIVFSNLRDWHERAGDKASLKGLIERLRGPLASVGGAMIIPFNPPSIQGLGNFGGFVFELQDMFGTDVQQLARVTGQMMMEAGREKEVTGVFSPFTANSPQLITTVLRDKARALKVLVIDVFQTLEIMLGSRYVNDFDLGNRIYRVYVQADEMFRSNPRDIDKLYVRSQGGDMVSLSQLVRVERSTAPQTISHYNLFRSAEMNGSAAPGVSSGQALAAMERLAKRVLPQGMSYEWTGISLEEKESGPQTLLLFALGIVVVFLVLAAQYESFVDPVIILLSVPLAMLGALLAQWLRHLDNDVFCQIGLVMLVGLASKNAILIVEFANHLLYARGLDNEADLQDQLVAGAGSEAVAGAGSEAVAGAGSEAVAGAGSEAIAGVGSEAIAGVGAAVGVELGGAELGGAELGGEGPPAVSLVKLSAGADNEAAIIGSMPKASRLLSIDEAVKEACAIRFRPILMTSLAFVMGILPLVFATGAGAHSRHSLGTAVCGGMVVSTILSLYFVPVIYSVVKSFMHRLKRIRRR